MFLKETLRLCCWKFSLFNGPWWKPWSSIHNCPGSIWNGMDLRLSAHNQTPKWITPGEVHKISVAGARLAPSSRNVPVLPHPYTHSNGVPLYNSRKIPMFIKPLIKKLNRMHMSYRSKGCWKKNYTSVGAECAVSRTQLCFRSSMVFCFFSKDFSTGTNLGYDSWMLKPKALTISFSFL